MSRSYQHHKIAWGRATSGGNNRGSSYSDDRANANRKEYGKILIRKRHWRAQLQTLQDYVDYLKDIYFTPKTYMCRDMKVRANFLQFLNGQEPTEEMFTKYANKLWKRDRSK